MVLHMTRRAIWFNEPCFHSKKLKFLIGFFPQSGSLSEKDIVKTPVNSWQDEDS